MLMLVSSLPNALVATQVKRAESVRSELFILRSERTPLGRISSRIVYLKESETGLLIANEAVKLLCMIISNKKSKALREP